MAKKYKAKAKTVNKITRDGMSELNLITGEDNNVSKKEKNFNLRQKTDELPKVTLKQNSKKNKAYKKAIKNKMILEQRQKNDKNANLSRENASRTDNQTLLESSPSTALKTETEIPINNKQEKTVISDSLLNVNRVKSGEFKNRSPTNSIDLSHKDTGKNKYYDTEPKKPTLTVEVKTELKFNSKDEGKAFINENPDCLLPPKEKVLNNKNFNSSYRLYDKYDKNAPSTVYNKDEEIKINTSDEIKAKKTESAIFVKFKVNKELPTLNLDKKEDSSLKDEKVLTATTLSEEQNETIHLKETLPDEKSDEAVKTDDKPKLQFSEDEKLAEKELSDTTFSKWDKKSEKLNTQLEKTKKKLPTKNKITVERAFDDEKQKARLKLKFEKEVLPPNSKKKISSSKPVAIVKGTGTALKYEAIHKVHQKISEVEHENVAVKAAHKTEQTIEGMHIYGKIKNSALRYERNKPYKKIEKLERKILKTNIQRDYQKVLSENPQLKSNVLSRMKQKQQIKKRYAKTARETKKAAQTTAIKAEKGIKKATKILNSFVRRHPLISLSVILIVLLLFIIISMFNTLTTGFIGGVTPMFATTYMASDTDIDKAELAYTEWETDLLLEAWNVANTHPGYDKYRYNIGDISHNPFELMAFLTVKYQEFVYEAIEADLKQIFNEQYKIAYTETTETQYDPNTDETTEYSVLTVTVTSRNFTDVIFSHMNDEQKQLYPLYMSYKGNRQYLESPFDFNWLSNISDYYGWRIHSITGNKNYHKGIDIAVPVGTDIYSGQDGIVTTATYDSGYGYYIVVEDNNGLQSKYAHCDILLASIGQEIKKGDLIAKSGNTGNSTGAHLHLEILKNGEYLNPIFFAITNDTGGGPIYGNPGSPMGDGSYEALIAEGEKYLGFPYVWGGSNPNTSFDCSGFICWILNQSGVANVGRTTAQGLYNQCVPISQSEAKPGDLIFFTGTYSSTNPVTHVGLYVGNGQMLHCGNPISYTSINTSYWQSHFYAFARLS